MKTERHTDLFSRIVTPVRNIVAMALLLTAGLSFAVAQDISTLATRYPELKIKQADGLPIRVAREDWSAAKRLVDQDGEWRKWVDSRKNALDGWISRFHDRPEWISGTQHELVDPKTQAPVKWLPDMPEPADGAGKFRQAWVSYARSYNFDQILEAARIYRLTGENRYAEWAAQQLDFYARNYSRWSLQSWNGKARMMGQSLDEATSCVQLIEATRLIEKAVSPERLAGWRMGLFLPMTANFRDSYQGFNNITLWLAVAIALVGYNFDDSGLVTEAIDGPNGVRALMKQGVTADFLWYEGSFSYNDYVLAALRPLFVQASLMGHASMLQREMLIAQNMLLAPVEFRFPDGNRPTPGDDRNARAPALNIGLHASLRRVLPTSAGLMQAARYKSWDSLVDPSENYPRLAEKLPSVSTQNFEAERMAVLKTDNWQLFVHYGQLTDKHAQQEALNYELYRDSTPVSVDQGTVAYRSQLHLNYFRRGVAHNVPLVNGAGQDGWALGKVVSFDAAVPSIEMVQPAYWKDASATRRLEIRNDVVSDKVVIRSKDQHRLGLLFNSECKFDLDDPALGPPSSSSPPVGPGFEYWSGVSRRAAPLQWSAKLICNNVQIRLSVKGSMSHTLFHGTVPATPVPSKREAIYMELTGKEANFDMQLSAVP